MPAIEKIKKKKNKTIIVSLRSGKALRTDKTNTLRPLIAVTALSGLSTLKALRALRENAAPVESASKLMAILGSYSGAACISDK